MLRRPQTHPDDIRLLSALMVAMLVVSFSQTILNTALPTIMGEFSGMEFIGLLSAAFVLASTLSMPLVGSIADNMDRKLLLQLSLALFGLANVLGAIAWDLPTLIAARAFQGLGGGAVMVLTQTILAAEVPARERAKFSGALGSVWALATTSGVLFGGMLTDGPGWRWIFWGTLPVVALSMLVVAINIPTRHVPKGETRFRFDVGGMLLLSVIAGASVFVASGTLAQMASVLALAVGALALIGFLVVESRSNFPLIPLTLFKNRTFMFTTLASMFSSGLASFVVLTYLPTYIQMALQHSAFSAGLILLPMIAITTIASTATGFYVSRTGRYILVPAIGSVGTVIGLVLLGSLGKHSSDMQVMLYTSILGAGIGTNVLLLTLIAQNAVPPRQIGVATSTNNLFRQVGAAAGIAGFGAVFAHRLEAALADGLKHVPGNVPELSRLMSLTPTEYGRLDSQLQAAISEAYAMALPPLFYALVPFAAIATLLISLVERKPLHEQRKIA